MPDENPTRDDLAEGNSNPEREILYKLTDGDKPIWSVDDLGLAIEDPLGAVDAVADLL